MPNKKLFTAPSVEGVRLRRSYQNISHNKLITMDFGKLYVSICEEVIPGDVVRVHQRVNVKFQPLITPTFSKFYMKTHLFFVPNRIVWDEWENFITSGKDGAYPDVLPTVEDDGFDSAKIGLNSLWDSFGLPVMSGTDKAGSISNNAALYSTLQRQDLLPVAFPFRAYRMIWNEFYRDEDLQDELPIDSGYGDLLPVAWYKDYFTSARPWQQKGVAPGIPLKINRYIPINLFPDNIIPSPTSSYLVLPNSQKPAGLSGDLNLRFFSDDPGAANLVWYADAGKMQATLTPSDLRFGMQLQKWMELNSRSGNRYIEFLRAQYAVSPTDERLDRPEYCGGMKQPVLVSEVLQTSATDAVSPQANRAAVANIIGASKLGTYRVKEHGFMIGVTFLVPEPEYQNQLRRQWTRRSRFDYYFRLFNDLSEQPVYNYEICPLFSDPDNKNKQVFGFTGRYNEYRTVDNQVCGQFRSLVKPSHNVFYSLGNSNGVASLDYWHTARRFNQDSPPTLSGSFIECKPTLDFLAVQNEPPVLAKIENFIDAFRPMSRFSNPGRVDHMG